MRAGWVVAAALILCAVLAAIIRFVGEAGLFDWAWPLLAAAFVLTAVSSLFLRFGAGIQFYPRSLAMRFALETALLEWQAVERFGSPDILFVAMMNKARRAARGTPFLARLDSILAIHRGDEFARETPGHELRSLLTELAGTRGPARPLRKAWLLPVSSLLPVSAAFALVAVIASPLGPAARTPSVDALLAALVIFGVAYAALRLVGIVLVKIHDARAARSYRTLLVSDRTAGPSLYPWASQLYREGGHLVAVFLEPDEAKLDWLPWAGGSYQLWTDRRGLRDALAAFGPHSDLVVVETNDAALAALIRSETNLDPSRYLALNRHRTAPYGYRWLEPLALRAPRSFWNEPPIDLHRASVLRRRPLWTDWGCQLRLVSAFFFALAPGGLFLAVLLLLSALGAGLPDQLLRARRLATCRAVLRVPRQRRVSRDLAPRRLEKRLWIASIILVLLAYAAVAPPLGVGWRFDAEEGAKYLPAAFLLCLLVGLGLVAGGLFLRKWTLDWNFRFLILRRNSRRFGYGHKASVMATCGKYGQVISLRDDTLDQTDADYGEWRESSLGLWFQIYSEIESTLRPAGFLHSWQRQVLIELEVTDFAVFDWAENITDNMRWELTSALERLPPHRILIVCAPANGEAVEGLLASAVRPGCGQPLVLREPRGPDDEYIWANHAPFERAFEAFLDDALAKLHREPRGPFDRVDAGALPYPADRVEAPR